MTTDNGKVEIPNRRDPKQITLNEEQLRDLIHNASSRDQTFLKRFFDPRRDIDNECGYPGMGLSPEISQYKAFYDTHCVATRVCEIYPLETWQVQPTVFEDDDPNIQTEFEKAWDELGSSLRGNSYYKNEEGSPVWNYLMNADILSGIGSFGIILLGFDDGAQLNEPIPLLSDEAEDEEPTWDTSEVEEQESSEPTLATNQLGSIDAQYTGGSSLANDKVPALKEGTKRKLIYMRAFDESLVEITRLELDRTSPRYGQPVMYRITLIDPNLAKSQNISMDLSCPEVHWTRVIHIAETKGANSEVFGIPRQQQVWRQLLNLYKLYGGAPEMYWRGALNGLSFETHPQLGGDVEIDNDSLKNQIENYRNSLQRDLMTSGMTVKSIAPTVVDPTPNIEIQIQAICIKLACPQRIFMGSERGELASSQDDSSWNDRLKHRQNTYVTPKIIIPFVDRMIATGVLPKPANRVIADKNQELEETSPDIPNSEPKNGSVIEAKTNGKPASQPVTNAFPPKTAPNSPKTPANGQNGVKPAFGKPSASGDPMAPQGMPAATPKQRVLPEKEESPGYCVIWPDLDSMTELQKADIGLKRTQAFMAFLAGNGESACTLIDFWTKFMYMTDEEAIALVEAVNQQIEEESRLTPDPEEARIEEMEMQGEQFDKELEAKKELAEQGHGFGLEAMDKEQSFAEKMADKQSKSKKPTTNRVIEIIGKLLGMRQTNNFNPNQPRDNQGQWSSGGSGGSLTKKDVGQILASQHFNKEAGKSAEQMEEKWVASETFTEMEIPLSAVAPATAVKSGAKSLSTGPIIVDKNITGMGRTEGSFGEPAPVLILDGKHRHEQARLEGKKTIKAFVGDKAKPHVEHLMKVHEQKQAEISLAVSEYMSSQNGSSLRGLKAALGEEKANQIRFAIKGSKTSGTPLPNSLLNEFPELASQYAKKPTNNRVQSIIAKLLGYRQTNSKITNNEGWVTTKTGQKIFIGAGGQVQPHGPNKSSKYFSHYQEANEQSETAFKASESAVDDATHDYALGEHKMAERAFLKTRNKALESGDKSEIEDLEKMASVHSAKALSHKQAIEKKEFYVPPPKPEIVAPTSKKLKSTPIDIGSEGHEKLSSKIQESKSSHNWSGLGRQLEQQQVDYLKKNLHHEHLYGNASNQIKARVALSKAKTHEDLQKAIDLLRIQ